MSAFWTSRQSPRDVRGQSCGWSPGTDVVDPLPRAQLHLLCLSWHWARRASLSSSHRPHFLSLHGFHTLFSLAGMFFPSTSSHMSFRAQFPLCISGQMLNPIGPYTVSQHLLHTHVYKHLFNTVEREVSTLSMCEPLAANKVPGISQRLKSIFGVLTTF